MFNGALRQRLVGLHNTFGVSDLRRDLRPTPPVPKFKAGPEATSKNSSAHMFC